MWKTVFVSATLLAVVSSQWCVSRPSRGTGEHDGFYCVCNSTYCDNVPSLDRPLQSNIYKIVTSSKAGLVLVPYQGIFGNVFGPYKQIGSIFINPDKRFQKIIGFGGAVTDSVGFNIKSLSEQTGDQLLRSYFGPDGAEYNMIRTPMGGTDFSDRPYSYAMTENDTSLRDFSLQQEDYTLKIPALRKAFRMSKQDIKLLTAPWSASPWMKTNNAWTNNGSLRPEYNQLWADYFVKFFKAYAKEGFKFWGTTCQNEPEINTYLDVEVNGMAWTRSQLRSWAVKYLSPTLNREGLSYIKIFAGDDNRQGLPDLPKAVMNDRESRKVFAGTAVHWYFDNTTSPTKLDETHEAFRDKLIIYTEACNGVNAEDRVILGSWKRGEAYASDIIQTMNHWVSSWIDWNMALNLQGGPTFIKNFVDSPIIVNPDADEFYKQPMFYAMTHFSKYVTRGSYRIDSKSIGLSGIEQTAFRDGRCIIVVILSKNDEETDLLIHDLYKGVTRLTIPPKSISTMKYCL